jgi:hypothetical protein
MVSPSMLARNMKSAAGAGAANRTSPAIPSAAIDSERNVERIIGISRVLEDANPATVQV